MGFRKGRLFRFETLMLLVVVCCVRSASGSSV